MNILFAIAPDRFMDEEYTVPKKALEEKGIHCTTASTIKGTCYGMHGEIVESDISFEDINPQEYDGIIIAGGIGCQDYLWRNETLINIVNALGVAGKVTAAICLAPVIIAEAGLLAGKQATVFATPASRRVMELDKAVLTDVPVVTDGMVVTARMPQDAHAFAEAILKLLA